MNTTTTPVRRVLGEKDPNAPLQTNSPRKPNSDLEKANPLAQRQSLKSPLLPLSPRAGQKRKLEEANDEELPESQDRRMPHPLSQMTDILSDSPSEHGALYKTSMEQYKSTPNTVLSSFRASQEESCQVEAQFEIHEEPSQQTLDKMHAITLPQNTSQFLPSLRPNLNKEGSQISLSMSSLIDFENNRSSQGDDDMQMIEEEELAEETRPKTQEDIRKEMLLEKAETLRTRLQLAIFKIQTNQVSQPFARLQIPKDRSSSPAMPAMSSSSPSSSSTVRGGGETNHTPFLTPETRVAMARARATMDPKPKVRTLSSVPMPKIAPTAFSARWANEPEPGEQSSHSQQANIPSSPPLLRAEQTSAHLLGRSSQMHYAGNRNQSDGFGEPRTPVRLSSPVSMSARRHAGHDNERVNNPQARTLHRPGGLTSSVVKGEAANSLLELVRGGGEGGAGPARSGGMGMCGL